MDDEGVPQRMRRDGFLDTTALAINIGALQVHDFRHAQPGRVSGHQHRALLEAGDRLEEGGDLLQAQDDRQW
ncbi:hypothetical protein [Paraburkholderia sp. RL17-337-BIB-A]|uniref:hypothetical protein n=1 Tax=Paraburkholderia sp. RL17-337-BIB-A TaxID=3031636 RepID=UPI0038B942A3